MIRRSPRHTALFLGLALAAAALMVLAPSSAPYALVFLLAAAWAAHLALRYGTSMSAEEIVRAILLLVIGGGLLLPAFLGLFHAGGTVVESLATRGGLASHDAFVLAMALTVLVLAARHWPAALGEGTFVTLAVILSLAVRLTWTYFVSKEPSSDFADMWSLASKIESVGLREAIASAVSPLYTRIYLERILPYLLPLRLLFGPEPSSYSVANAVSSVLSSLLAYGCTRHWFGKSAARAALVVSLAAVEPVLAAEIPTHDVPGALYTMLALAVFLAALRLHSTNRFAAALVMSILFGVLTVVVELQRATGLFLLLSCTIFGLAALRRPAVMPRRMRAHRGARACFALALIPAALFVLGRWGLREACLTVPPEMVKPQLGKFMAAATDSWGDGSWGHFHTEYEIRYAEVPVNWRRLAAVKLASDTAYSPWARLASYIGKTRTLFDLGSQTNFYLRGARLASGGDVETAQEKRVSFISRCFTVVFLAGLLAGCARLWRSPDVPFTAFLPLFYLAVLAGLLILLGEVQPRYLYQIWYIGAIYVGHFVAGRSEPNLGE